MERKDKEKQRRDKWEKIKELKYNKWYKAVKGVKLPEERMGGKKMEKNSKI